MKKIILVMFALLMVANEALAFNTYGHQAVIMLAHKYLSDNAKKETKAILKESSMFKEAVWLNTLRKKPEMAHSKDWHFFRLDENGKSTTLDENDGVVVLEKAIAVLRDRKNHSDSLVNASLRTVIHLVADIHCLSHIYVEGIEETKGYSFFHWNEAEGKASREWKAQWYTLWNNSYFNRYRVFPISYYADDIDIHCNAKKAEYEKGTPRFWAENTGEDTVRALNDFPMGQNVPTRFIQLYEYNHVKCVAKAGYRLAALLNDIFK
jgi:hypothetical protein